MAEQLRMPKLSQTMTLGRIVEWLKHEGDPVEKGQPLVTIESDKASVDVEAPATGVLHRVLVAAGDEVDVGAPIAVIAAAGEEVKDLPAAGPAVMPAPATAAEEVAVPTGSAPSRAGRQPVSPAARRLAREMGVDLAQVKGSGEDGLVTEKDVRTFAAGARAESPEAPEDVEVVPLTALRRRIAERLSLSRRSAADVTTVADVDMTEVAALRKASGLSYTAYVAWAVSRALREFPILNASFAEDRILVKKSIHLGVAVALDEGLVVPVLRDADRKTLDDIGREIDTLAATAREGKLSPSELSGSTFTITNSGAFGSLLFTPIINYPEVAILGMGKVADTPVVRDGEIVARKLMYLSLSYDHRAIDGAPAVRFLQAVKRRLEQPDVVT